MVLFKFVEIAKVQLYLLNFCYLCIFSSKMENEYFGVRSIFFYIPNKRYLNF